MPSSKPRADRRHLFVYGTLLPGDVRFHLMEPFVVDEGWPDRIVGRLYDTGEDYPAAVLKDPGLGLGLGSGLVAGDEPFIIGRTFALLEETYDRAIDLLDDVEGVVDGDYRRVPVTTTAGAAAWVYEGGGDLDLRLIENGDWLAHRPPDQARPLAP